MSSLETLAAVWTRHAWSMLWVFTVVCAAVIVLRRPLRRVFGAEPVPLLWLLVPLALLAVESPHPATPIAAMPPVVVRIAAGASWVPPPASAGWNVPWQVLAMLGWLGGALAVVALIGVAQSRYARRLRTAQPLVGLVTRCPVWRAGERDLGPAMVGAWRVRIVLPADFETRYSPAEQALILAHEQAHARRHDGLWRLLAQGLAALFWFHPLAWYALACMRQDQELACDAVVLREHGAPRRDYASAMLKTQASPLSLPVGCSWSSRHPLTERVAMLKQPVPARSRRWTARMVLGAIVAVGSLGVYATRSSPSLHHPSAEAVKEAMALFDGAKTAVAIYWSDHGFDLPSNNEAAQLPDATLITGKYVADVKLDRGRLTATLKDSAAGGHVVLVPVPDVAHKTMDWLCRSPDIAEIAQLSKGCVYTPAVVSDGSVIDGRFTLKLAASIGGQPAQLHSTTCLKEAEDAYRFVNGEDKALQPWKGEMRVVNGPDGQMEVRARLSGGSLSSPVNPAIRMQIGQQGAIQVGKVVAGVDHTLRLDVTAWPGCGAQPVVVDDGAVHARFTGPSARVLAAAFASRAGLALLDPEALDDDRPVAGNFEGVPAREALRLIGDMVGMKPVFTPGQVRFETK